MARLITKKSTVAAKVPLATDLEIGELAVNTADAKLYTKHSDGNVVGLKAEPLAHAHAISDVTGLQTALDAKQDTLVSGTNIKTINGTSLLGSGDITAGDVTLAGTQTLTNKTLISSVNLASSTATQDGVIVTGRSGGTGSYRVTLQPTTLTSNRTLTLPDNTGTVLTTGAAVTAAQGGTGRTSLTVNNVILGNGTSAVNFVDPGTSGNVLTSNGSTWVSSAPGAAITGLTQSVTPYITRIGSNAGLNLNTSSGENNTVMGWSAGKALTGTGTTRNTIIGAQALMMAGSNQSNNTVLGERAGYQATTCSNSILIGVTAGGGGASYSNAIAIGSIALYKSSATGGTGSSTVAIGRGAGYLKAPDFCTLIGDSAGRYQNSSNLTCVGTSAGAGNDLTNGVVTPGLVAVGYDAASNCATGADYSVAVGFGSLPGVAGANNVAVGYQAGYQLTTGANNTFVGALTSRYTNGVTTGSNNTCIGYYAHPSSATVSNTITLGDSSITTLRCQVTTITSLSDERDKTDIQALDAGLAFVKKLKPVRFTWNMRDGGKVGDVDTGFIAQDLKAVQEETGNAIPGLVFADNPEKLEAGYSKLLPVLVKAIQDLSAEVEMLKAKMESKNA